MPVTRVPRALVPLLAVLVAAPLALVRPGRLGRRHRRRHGRARPALDPSRRRTTPPRPLTVRIDSNRADLVSGGNVLTTVVLPKRVAPREVRVRLNGRDVTDQFRLRPNGRFQALLRGLEVGRNVRRRPRPRLRGTPRRDQPPQRRPDLLRPPAHPLRLPVGRAGRAVQRSRRRTPSSTSPPTRRSRACSPTTATTRRRTSPPRRPTRASRCRSSYAVRTASRTATATRSSRSSGPAGRGSRGRRRSSGTDKVVVPHGGNCGASYTPGEPAPRRLLRHHPRRTCRCGLRAELRRRARARASRCCRRRSTTPGTTATCRSRRSR